MISQIGIEIEFRGLSPDFIPNCIRQFGSIGDDRSVRVHPILVTMEKSRTRYNLVPADSKTEKFFLQKVNFIKGNLIGTEFVTSPLSLPQAKTLGRYVADMLGHLPFLPETSIHIHVDVAGVPWTYIHKVILLFLALEQGYYRLAAGGQKHRGEQYRRRFELRPVYDDYRYCRPISVPIAVRNKNDTSEAIPCVDVDKLIDASTATELMAAWGRLDRMRRIQHYIPHRLMGLNLTSVPRQGTLEWRIFDGRYALLPYYIDLVIDSHALAYQMNWDRLKNLAASGYTMAKLPQVKITKDHITEILGKRPWIDALWGDGAWSLDGVSDRLLLSHYDANGQWTIDPTAPYTQWVNNNGVSDDYTLDYSLYI